MNNSVNPYLNDNLPLDYTSVQGTCSVALSNKIPKPEQNINSTDKYYRSASHLVKCTYLPIKKNANGSTTYLMFYDVNTSPVTKEYSTAVKDLGWIGPCHKLNTKELKDFGGKRR